MKPAKKTKAGYQMTGFGKAVGDALYGYLRSKRISRARFAEMPNREVSALLGKPFREWLRARKSKP